MHAVYQGPLIPPAAWAIAWFVEGLDLRLAAGQYVTPWLPMYV